MSAPEHKEDEQNDQFLVPDEGNKKTGMLVDAVSNRPVTWNKRLLWRIENHALALSDGVKWRFAQELETGLLFNLTPVFLGLGIVLYFIAPQEPAMTAIAIGFCVAAALLSRITTYRQAYFLIAAIVTIFAGMAAAKLSVLRNATPQIERQITASMNATIIEIDQNRRGSPRLTMKPHAIDGLSADELPRYIRASAASGAADFLPGQQIEGLVRLQPVLGPAFPGSYDFGFHAWFQGLGGSGFFMGKPQRVLGEAMPISILDTGRVSVNRFRQDVENRIREALPAKAAGITIALVTGNKSGIDAESQDLLRRTGLAHILAISGLHMALVTLTLIWVVRFLFALSPAITLNYPVKKFAVCLAFLGASFYLLLSGAGIATQRAWIMISIMLLAVLLDRRAVTMRSVVISACIILILSPESLLSPGFQMSFAAVAALVAGYEALNKWRHARLASRGNSIIAEKRAGGRMIESATTYFGGLAITSLIAGTATAFVAAWHFHQVAPFGLLANLLAMPVFALTVMPLIMFSLLLMPFGFETVALQPVPWGVDGILQVAKWVQTISPDGVVGIMPISMIGVFGVSLALLTLFKTRLRLFAFAPVLLFLPYVQPPRSPDILISENGRAIGLVSEEALFLAYPKSSGFVTEIWAKAYADGHVKAIDNGRYECNRERCILEMERGGLLHIVYNPDLLKESCKSAEVLIAPRLWWVNCYDEAPELVLKRHDFEQYGSHEIYFETNALGETGYRVETAMPNTNRPWSRKVRPK